MISRNCQWGFGRFFAFLLFFLLKRITRPTLAGHIPRPQAGRRADRNDQTTKQNNITVCFNCAIYEHIVNYIKSCNYLYKTYCNLHESVYNKDSYTKACKTLYIIKGSYTMTNYINTIYPKSNKIKGISYLLLIEGNGITRAETFDDLETVIQQTQRNKQTIKKAVMMQYGLPVEFTPETTQERFDREEGFERCKRIAEELEAYTDGIIYRCPDCDEEITIPADVGDKFKCPHCHEVNDVDDFEQLSLYDYFDDILDIEYLVNYRKEYKACKICVAWGGPSIYIDTESRAVELYWWGNRASYSLLSSTVEAVDEWAEEYFNCI